MITRHSTFESYQKRKQQKKNLNLCKFFFAFINHLSADIIPSNIYNLLAKEFTHSMNYLKLIQAFSLFLHIFGEIFTTSNAMCGREKQVLTVRRKEETRVKKLFWHHIGGSFPLLP
jgi:hypothetical protein